MSSMGPERPNRRQTLEALKRAVRIYWEHEKALPIPDHLAQLASKADEALAKRVATPSMVPSKRVGSGEHPINLTQVKPSTERC